jgi:membrane protein required for colicin V production
MNGIDIVIVVVAVLFCLKGYFHGFINEIFSLVIIAAGLFFAFLFYRPVADALVEVVANRDLSLILSFAGIFICAAIMLFFVRNGLLRVVENVNFTDADSALGAIVGLFKGFVLCGFVFMFLKNHAVLNLEKRIGGSLIYPYVERTTLALISLLPGSSETFVRKLLGI